jgi:glycosyltransferase
VTVCRNAEETIVDTLQSVADQSFVDFEYIIHDGASDDSTVQKIQNFLDINKQFGEKVNFKSSPDNGIYDALNRCYAKARGMYIGTLNADDLLNGRDVLAGLAREMIEREPQMLYSDLVYVDRKNVDKVVRTWISGKFDRHSLASGWMPPHPTVYIRRDVFKCVKGYRLDLPVAADYEFLLRVMAKLPTDNIAYLRTFLVRMRVGGVSNNFLSAPSIFLEDFTALKMNGYDNFQAFKVAVKKKCSKLVQYF